MVGAMQTELRYERWFLPLSVPLGLGPKKSEVRIADGTLQVKMGWGFEAHIPVASITRGEATEEPPAKAKAAFRAVTLRSLVVSVTDPDALITACTVATG
jgi:hypothetical protein